MRVFTILRSKPILVVALLLLVTIFLFLGAIYLVDQNAVKSEELKGYYDLKAKINALSKDTSIGQDGQYFRMVNKFNEIGTLKFSNERYNAFLQSATLLQGLYSFTNNPKLYPLFDDYKNFAKLNFPQYKEDDFSSFCQDPSCAEEPQPEEIKKLMDEIKASNIIDRDKETLIRDITNVGYLGNEDINSKVLSYLSIAYNIKIGPRASDSAYLNVAQKIQDYIKINYSDELKELDVENLL